MHKGKRRSERGQAIVLIAMAIVGLVGFTALSVDGGFAYADQRQAQNAADTAALSSALAKVRGNSAWATIGQSLAAANGYDNNGTTNTVTVISPPTSGPYTGNSEYIQVTITSLVDTFFAPVVGVEQVTNVVEAVARAKPPTRVIPFDGAAVVGLNPSNSGCAFDSGNSGAVRWILKGGGIFSNGCAFSKNGDSVDLPNDKCVFTVGDASNFTCQEENQSALFYDEYDIAGMMPATPPCDGTATGGYNVPNNPSSFTFTDGIYCVSNFDAFRKEDIVLNNATLYVNDDNFDVGFQGGGGFTGSASTSGSLKGIYLFVAPSDTPCPRFTSNTTQVLEYRGNGAIGTVGMILAPTACIDFRGNSNGEAIHSQVIGYNVTSNGAAALLVQYDPNENTKLPVPPEIQLSE
jgi:hypothetical protein